MHTHNHNHTIQKGLNFAFWLNISFAVIELIGGVYTNSTAILTDAFHDFMDALAIGIAVWMEKIANKPADHRFNFGYKRFSVLSAIILSVVLLFGSYIMISEAISSFNTTKMPNSVGMFILAIVGILINGAAFINLKNGRGEHHHHVHTHASHDHSAHSSEHNNSKAVMLHLLEDVLGWVAVLIGAAVMYFTDWYWIDGVLAIAIGCFIAYNAIKNLISSFKILLDANPLYKSNISLQLADATQLNISDVQIRSLDGNEHEAYIFVADTHPLPQSVIHSIEHILAKKGLTKYYIVYTNVK